MTESRGAMTAQQFEKSAEWAKQREMLGRKIGTPTAYWLAVADALSARNMAHWKERAEAAEQAILVDDKKLADALHINYCEDLIEDGTPWEVHAEPEPSYFESLHEAIGFLVNLPDPNTAEWTKAAGVMAKRAADAEIQAAELRAALEAKEKELAIQTEYAKKAFYEMSAILDLAGTENIYKLTNRLNSFKAELERLRSQGAGSWEAAAREAAKEIKTSPTGHMTCRLSEGHIFDIILKHFAGLASPPEGQP